MFLHVFIAFATLSKFT